MFMHADFFIAQKTIYEPSFLLCDNFVQDCESQEYAASTFTMNHAIIKFRVAKITPKKIGQFVTLWKRIGNGPIMPYDMADQVNFFIVSVRKDDNVGQFIFPKDILRHKGVLSDGGIGGKRAMRVYPPWDTADNAQSKATQRWQLLYFVAIQPVPDIDTFQKLLQSSFCRNR